MEKGLTLLVTEPRVVTKADPRLRLLLELQPRHEVFFSNLADLFSRRAPAPFKGTSPPGSFWHDVFVPTELPWKSFQESLLWHMVVMIAAWALTQGWATRPRPHVNQSSYRASGAVYYSPSKAYPSARRSTPRQTSTRRLTRRDGVRRQHLVPRRCPSRRKVVELRSWSCLQT